MVPLCILFAHHNNDAVTRHHLDLLRANNPYPVIPLCNAAAEHVEDAVDVSKFSNRFAAEDRWQSSDVMIYLWFRHHRTVEAERYAYVEWDALATQPLRDYYDELWDADVAAPRIKTPQTSPQWEWFGWHGARLPERLRPFAAGIAPLNGVLLSRRALQAVADSPLPKNVFSELRLGSLLRSNGIALTPFSQQKARNNDWHPNLISVSNEPGFYHPVKSLQPAAAH